MDWQLDFTEFLRNLANFIDGYTFQQFFAAMLFTIAYIAFNIREHIGQTILNILSDAPGLLLYYLMVRASMGSILAIVGIVVFAIFARKITEYEHKSEELSRFRSAILGTQSASRMLVEGILGGIAISLWTGTVTFNLPPFTITF